MKQTTLRSNYKNYITGLKSFACIMVMIGHFIGIYKYAENFPAKSNITQLFDIFLDSKLSFILDETFWVILFFVVSGYLVAMSNIPDIKTFAVKCFMRFLRLGLPILFAYAAIFLIYKTIGFHTTETLEFFENSFIQKNYTATYSLLQILKSPVDVLILGETTLNGPYWVLREMFFSSIIIYFFAWLKNRFANNNIILFALLITTVISMVFSNIIFAGLFGMLLHSLEQDNKKEVLSNKIFIVAAIAFCASLYFIPRSRIACLFFGALIVFLPKLPLINAIFSSKIALFFGKISFGIYSFHWPVFCSIGMLSLINMQQQFGLLKASAFCIIISIVATIIVSILFYYTFEKWIYLYLKKAENFRRKSHA